MPRATAARLGSLISPLRRSLLGVARSAEHLPEIPDAQIEVLRALPVGTERTPGELAAELGLSRPTISNLLRDMEGTGLITRRGATEDRRRVLVAASARAIDLLDRFDRASATVIAEVLDRLGDEDRRALDDAVGALERLRDAVERVSRGDEKGGRP